MAIRYKVVESGSHPSAGDMEEEYKKGYLLINVAAWKDQGIDRYYATYYYTGAKRMPGNLIN